MGSRRIAFLFAATACLPATAQTTVAELTAPAQIFAQAGPNTTTRALAAGPITSARSAHALAACCLGMAGAEITMTVAPLPHGASWSARSAATVACVAGSYCPFPEGCGDLVVRAPGFSVGSVQVTVLAGPVGAGSFWVDVGDDGTRELQGALVSQQRTFRSCGARDLVVRARADANSGSNSGSGGSETFELRIEVFPGLAPVAAVAYGTDCQASMVISDQPVGAVHNITFAVSGGFPNALAVLLLGLGRTQIPIQGCFLYTIPLVAPSMPSNGLGGATFSFPVPGVISGFGFQAQGVSADATLQVRTSAGADVIFRDC